MIHKSLLPFLLVSALIESMVTYFTISLPSVIYIYFSIFKVVWFNFAHGNSATLLQFYLRISEGFQREKGNLEGYGLPVRKTKKSGFLTKNWQGNYNTTTIHAKTLENKKAFPLIIYLLTYFCSLVRSFMIHEIFSAILILNFGFHKTKL